MNTKQLTAFAESMMRETSTQVGEWVIVSRIALDEMARETLQVIKELEAAERERDELRLEIARIGGAKAIDVLRRDAAAGEPLAFTHESEISNMHATGLYIRGLPADRRLNAEEGYTVALYTAAPHALLPPEMKPEPDKYDVIDHGFIAGYNKCRSDALVLGAQQQKGVELPQPVKWPEIPFKYFSEEQVFSMLDAAGVKWEVRK